MTTSRTDDDWKIACHEAGHALTAQAQHISIEMAEVGPNEHGVVVPSYDTDDEGHNFGPAGLKDFQLFYAGGAAAERVLFGSEREYASKGDRVKHAELEKQLGQNRDDGFNDDVETVTKLLAAQSSEIQYIATALLSGEKLNDESISKLLGRKPPWE
jgi:hypothetical protein